MCVKQYKLFDRDKQIGVFTEDWSDKAKGVQLSITLDRSLDLNHYRYWALRAIQKDYVIDDWGVRFWIDERCTPETQDGIDDKLKAWGLSEYDQLSIMHQSSAINLMDSLWVQFNPNATFERNHPNGGKFEKILGMFEAN